MARIKPRKNTPDIPVIGDVDHWEADAVKALLEVPERGECVFYIDSAGGSVYGALALVTLLRIRQIRATAVVLSECSSATLLLFGACPRRFVTPYSTLFFHRMRWQSEKRVAAEEAAHWAKHFSELENDLDELQAKLFTPAEKLIRDWTRASRYVSGTEFAAAGLAQLVEL